MTPLYDKLVSKIAEAVPDIQKTYSYLTETYSIGQIRLTDVLLALEKSQKELSISIAFNVLHLGYYGRDDMYSYGLYKLTHDSLAEQSLEFLEWLAQLLDVK